MEVDDGMRNGYNNAHDISDNQGGQSETLPVQQGSVSLIISAFPRLSPLLLIPNGLQLFHLEIISATFKSKYIYVGQSEIHGFIWAEG